MALQHEVDGWVYDVTRHKFNFIREIHNLAHDDQAWSYYGCPSEPMYAIRLNDNSSTHYLTVTELNELYPYVGKNVASLEVLYGSK